MMRRQRLEAEPDPIESQRLRVVFRTSSCAQCAAGTAS
jgi:hypothetical protein